MNTPREEHMVLMRLCTTVRREKFYDLITHLLPQHKAGAGPHMSAAFSPFENKSCRSILEEHLQKLWRRDVQVSGDTILLERSSLIWPPSRDQGKRRAVGAHSLELFLSQLQWNEA